MSSTIQEFARAMALLGEEVAQVKRERDEARDAQRVAERRSEEYRGIIETYGVVQILRLPESGEWSVTLRLNDGVRLALGPNEWRRAFIRTLEKQFEAMEQSANWLVPSSSGEQK